MASKSLRSSPVEFHESEISKPQPLRIIKRSQTVTGCPGSREAFGGGRESSGSSSEGSRGSPTWGEDQKLTIHKKRRGRGSVFDVGSEDGSFDGSPKNPIPDLIRKYSDQDDPYFDPELTPKAPKQLPRTLSAGAFLKSELHQRSSDIEANMFSVRNNRHSMNPCDVQSYSTPIQDRITLRKLPERHPSKSRNSFLRAIIGRGKNETGVQRTNSTNKSTVRRRLSRSKNNSSSSGLSNSESVGSRNTDDSSAPDSCDIADVGVNSRLCSYQPPFPSTTNSEVAHVLCPQIIVTPEVSSISTTSCSLWAAIEVTGVLRKADGNENCLLDSDQKSQHLAQNLDPERYGRLHSLSIDVQSGPGCTISELVGNIHETKTILLGETQLILAKIRVSKVAPSRRNRDSSADDLMAELESDLGHMLTSYLTVHLEYKHSGFPDYSTTPYGLRFQTTHLRTEATAVIRRHNPQSAWSPRSSQTMNSPRQINPLLRLIENHLPPDDARDAMNIVCAPPTPIPFARRNMNPGGSSEETVKPPTNIGSRFGSPLPVRPVLAFSASIDGRGQFSTESSSPFSRIDSRKTPQEKERENSLEEMDPARKIWSEMRQASRSNKPRRHARNNISPDFFREHDAPQHSEGNLNSTPSRGSSGQSFASTLSRVSTVGLQLGAGFGGEVEEVREKIMEVALRNKRSVGMDSLRSMAPSVMGMRGKAGAGGGAGSNGRGWAWGPPWW